MEVSWVQRKYLGLGSELSHLSTGTRTSSASAHTSHVYSLLGVQPCRSVFAFNGGAGTQSWLCYRSLGSWSCGVTAMPLWSPFVGASRKADLQNLNVSGGMKGY